MCLDNAIDAKNRGSLQLNISNSKPESILYVSMSPFYCICLVVFRFRLLMRPDRIIGLSLLLNMLWICILTGRTVVKQFCFKTFTLQGLPHNHDKVAIVMLIVFCIGTVAFTILEIISEAACLIHRDAATDFFLPEHIAHILFLGGKIIFVALQVRSSYVTSM